MGVYTPIKLLTWEISYIFYFILETEKSYIGYLNDMIQLFGNKKDLFCV